MKKWLGLAAVAGLLIGVAAQADIVGNSKHNLSSIGPAGRTYYSTSTSEICIFCHTAHGGDTTVPLWNRGLATSGFTMYSSPTMNMTIVGQPQGVSAACLSCHDGTTAMTPNKAPATGDTGTWAAAGNMLNAGNAYLAKDLSNDHPISVTYNPAVDNAPTAWRTLADAKIAGASFYGATGDQVECASCHNAHDNVNGKFLRMSNAGSNLCLACHQK